MITTVSAGPLQPPLLVTQEASQIEVRDDDGHLVRAFIFINGEAHLEFGRNDPDFEACCSNFKVREHIPPGELLKT